MSDGKPLTVRRSIYGIPTAFRWWGGEYVEVCPFDGEAVDCLNVWGDGSPRGPKTRAFLLAEVKEWKAELDRDDWFQSCGLPERGMSAARRTHE